MVPLCFQRREMNDSVDDMRHIYLRTVAKQTVYAEFDLAILTDVNTRIECRHATIGPSTAVVRCTLGS